MVIALGQDLATRANIVLKNSDLDFGKESALIYNN